MTRSESANPDAQPRPAAHTHVLHRHSHGVLPVAAFMQGYFADNCNWVERIVLLILAVAMFRPALVTDEIGLQREIIQGIALALWILMYLYQKRRKAGRGGGTAPAAA